MTDAAPITPAWFYTLRAFACGVALSAAVFVPKTTIDSQSYHSGYNAGYEDGTREINRVVDAYNAQFQRRAATGTN